MSETGRDTTVDRSGPELELAALKEQIRTDSIKEVLARSGAIDDPEQDGLPTAQEKLTMSVLNLYRFAEARAKIISEGIDPNQKLSIDELKNVLDIHSLAGEVLAALVNLDATRFVVQVDRLRWARKALENAVRNLPTTVLSTAELFKQDLGLPKNY